MFCIGQSFICTEVPRKSFQFTIAGSPTIYLGFSLMGFITFQSYVYARLVSLTLLQAVSMDHSLGNLASRQHEAAQAYCLTWHKHYIHRRMCEHGLSSDRSAIVSMLFVINDFFQTGNSLQYVNRTVGSRIGQIKGHLLAFEFNILRC